MRADCTLINHGSQVSGILLMDAYEANPDGTRRADYTEAAGQVTEVVYTPPSNYRVESILSPPRSHKEYYDTNESADDFPGGEGPVMSWRFVGDTDGDEAGTRTQVTIKFNEIKVHLVQTGGCVTSQTARHLLASNALSAETRSRFLAAAVSHKIVVGPH